MEAPGGLFQLGVLVGGQLWWSRGQQVGVGVRLDGTRRRIVGIGLALLHGEEGATGFGAGHFDPTLIAVGTAVCGRSSGGVLGGIAVIERLMLRRDWLPAVGLGLLSLQLLPPDVVQQDLTVPPTSSSPSTTCSAALHSPL